LISILISGNGPGDINVDNVGLGFVFGATGGSGGSLAGEGGTINVLTTGDISVNNAPVNLAFGPLGTGNGGHLSLITTGQNNAISVTGNLSASASTDGNGGTIFLSAVNGVSPGNSEVSIVGNLTADGAASGSGGTITGLTNSSNDFAIGSAGVQGVTGTITANGGAAAGGGGSIFIQNQGDGGISLATAISATGSAAGGAGGTVTLDSEIGQIALNTGASISASAQGNGFFDGGSIKLFSTALRGEHGATADVEVSAVSLADGYNKQGFGFAIRNVEKRLSASASSARELPRSVAQLTELIGRVPLRDLVREATDVIEKLSIEAALELTGDNRASAAEMLGLSRQSLYVKLRRFGLAEHAVDEESDDE